MQVQLSNKSVQLLTSNYSIEGTIQPIGSFALWVNDPTVPVYRVTGASITPLIAGSPAGTLSGSEIYVPREMVEVVIIDNFSAAEANLLPKTLGLTLFTSTYAVKGTFYGGAETKGIDIFQSPGPMFPATGVEVYSVRPLNVPISGVAPLAFVNKHTIESYLP